MEFVVEFGKVAGAGMHQSSDSNYQNPQSLVLALGDYQR